VVSHDLNSSHIYSDGADLLFCDLSSLKETGYLYSTQADRQKLKFRPRLLSQDKVDLSFVKQSIDYCKSKHGTACNVAASTSVVGLRVIDCETRQITPALAQCQYIALSYVWGPSKSTQLDDAPKTVNDSIDITQKLGFRYLWIDRYCIDQSDEVDKKNQICQMHLIYQNAQVTIMAAAGEDPLHGLAGINETPRKKQPYLNYGDYSIISTLPSFKFSVENSKWATRGWTYQEGLFSRRRLIFTDEQTLFECNGMQCHEALVQDLESVHVDNKGRYRERYHQRSFYWHFPSKNSHLSIMKYLSEFSERKLSFSSDTLNAVEGMFSAYSQEKRPVYQLLGVIILLPYIMNGTPTGRTPEESFVMGLCWFHYEKSVKRRSLFPSWSWAGWEGKLSEILLGGYIINSVRLNDIKIWTETDDKLLTRFPDWSSLPDFLACQKLCKNQFIHIESTTFELSIVYLSESFLLIAVGGESLEETDPRNCYFAKFQVDKNTSIYAKLDTDRKDEDLEILANSMDRQTRGIFVGEKASKSYEKAVIVVEEMEEYAERLAIFGFNSCSYTEHGDEWTKSCIKPLEKWLLKGSRPKRTIRMK
jgi:hypothetical protein